MNPCQVKVVYASTVDISLPNGPGVNEREFVRAMHRRFGVSAGFVLPLPKNPHVLDGLPNCRTFNVTPRRLHHLVAEFGLFRQLRRMMRHGTPRLVVSRCGLLPFGLAAFVLLRRAPVALKTHGDPTLRYLCESKGLKGWVARRLRPLSIVLSRLLVKRVIVVDACTPQLVERNIACHPGVPVGRFLMVGNATNLESFRPQDVARAREHTGLLPDAMVLGYVGGVPWERGGRQIIKAVAALSGEHPALVGVVVGGRGQGLEELRQLAVELGVADRCVLPGEVPYDTVPDWIASFDVCVAMDLPERAGYVGSSNQKIRQYLASAKPVIAAAGVNEFLEMHSLGITVPPDDDAAFQQAVRAYMDEDPGLGEQRRLRARKYAEDYLSVDYTLALRVDAWRKAGVDLETGVAP